MPTVKRTREQIDLSRVDWAKVDRATDEEIDAMIAADVDTAPAWADQDLAAARRVVPDLSPHNVRAIRQNLGLSQQAFADRFGFSVETIRNYEQGHRVPRGPARVLLAVIASDPEAVIRALAEQRSGQ